jgi:hypothetical protein
MHRTVRSIGLLLVAMAPSLMAQADLSTARPGRDPKQAIDQEYTKKILEYTTEPFFLSPLVDYLPASKTVPTPRAVLRDIAGSPTQLPYSKEVYDYMRLLEKATPRVKVYSIGRTEENREMIAVAIGSEQLMARYASNKAALAKLADPRTINMNDAEADRIAATAAPVYYLTGAIHSTESGSPSALMELAYRLAVDESPYVKHIRDNVITLITPVVEVDGRDRMVDLYEWRKKNPGQIAPNLIYWGKYVAHDNNRDAMGVTLKLTENVLNTFVNEKAMVLHDLHESVAYLYDNTIGDGPYNSWLDPIVTNEWQMIGWNNVNEMTRLGMPGVFAHGTFDTWSPGYLMFIAATHNGISRLYETFGNGGTAETQERTLSAEQTSRTWYRQNPPLPRVKWSLRNNNNYQQTGILVSLNYVATNRRQLLRNFYDKSKRSVEKPKTEGPAAYVLPANDPRLQSQAELLRILQKQHVEISRATSEFTVTIPRRGGAASGGGRGRGGANNAAADSAQTASAALGEKRTFPAGSYIIRMDQPYSRIADALLDYQYWSPNDPQKNPYDDTGWTFPEAHAVQAIRIVDTTVLRAPTQPVTGTITAPGGIEGGGDTYLINANADNALATLRYKLRSADFQAAEEPFEASGRRYNRGSFIIRNVDRAALDAETKRLGLKVSAVATAPTVKTHPVRAARVALMHTWLSTQTEGWWRLALDKMEIPYDYVSTHDVAKTPDLRAKWDVILFGPGGGNAQAIIQGIPQWRNAMPWRNSPETPNIGTYAQTDDIRPGLGYDGLQKIQAFVAAGGVFVGVENTADFAIQMGLTNGVSSATPSGNTVVGSLLRTKLADETSPIAYGIIDNMAVYSSSGMNFSVTNQRGGRAGGGGGGGGAAGPGGGRGGGGATRATGRGTLDDVDNVPGRPNYEPRNLDPIPVRTPTSPWQVAVPTEEQMRNPLNIIPPDQRPRVPLRFADQRELLVSGLLDGGGDIAQRPVVVDAPFERGHVVLFANNPIYRGTTIGSYALVLNTILHFDNLNAGRVLPPR